MKKRYGQIVRTCFCAALFSSLALIAGGIVFYFTQSPTVGAIEAIIGALLLITVCAMERSRRDKINRFLDILPKNTSAVSSNLINAFPIPVAAVHIDGTVFWGNDKFSELFGGIEIFDKKLDSLIPDIKWGELLKSADRYERRVAVGERRFLLEAYIIQNKPASSGREDRMSVYVYLIDKTAEIKLRRMYASDRTDVAIINIDNYEDVLQRVNDSAQQQILSEIRKCVNEWAERAEAILKLTDRDRYYMLFEHKHLDAFIESKFDILAAVRNVGDSMKLPVSISVGVGVGGNLRINDTYARSALDMALGRGGDQACVKDDTQYKFYGGKARDYERSTRVKTRSVAAALKDFIKSSDKVIFMGHSGADYDCFGAAMGLQRAVRVLGKQPYIVHDGNSPAISHLYDELRDISEYRGMFVGCSEAADLITPDTLLVVLDTHRPSMLPSQEVLNRAAKVVLVDHHRRSTDFLSPCSLTYHEPYASSTCEMATELLEYMDLGSYLTTLEAESLYTGILMDTKNFILKTGVRTFEAASYLKRLGLNMVNVRKLFNVDKDEYDHRADIVKTSRVIAPRIAVAVCGERCPNIRVIASQAADDMLTISDIHASVVVYPLDGEIGISARSLGDINVQLIMEYLGGGGHSTVAGAQLRNMSIDAAVEEVKRAVNKYLKDNEE